MNKSLEAVLDVHDHQDEGSKTKATDHYRLLDKQEKERQESLEVMVEKLNDERKVKSRLMKELEVIRDKLQSEKDASDKADEDRLRNHMKQKKDKMLAGRDKEQDKDDGDNGISKEERRKRKRDAEHEEEHVDIDMLL